MPKSLHLIIICVVARKPVFTITWNLINAFISTSMKIVVVAPKKNWVRKLRGARATHVKNLFSSLALTKNGNSSGEKAPIDLINSLSVAQAITGERVWRGILRFLQFTDGVVRKRIRDFQLFYFQKGKERSCFIRRSTIMEDQKERPRIKVDVCVETFVTVYSYLFYILLLSMALRTLFCEIFNATSLGDTFSSSASSKTNITFLTIFSSISSNAHA